MSTGVPNTNVNSNTLTVMSSLLTAINNLDQHIQQLNGVQEQSQASNSLIIGNPNRSTTAQASEPSAIAALLAQQQAQQQLQQTTITDQSEQNATGSPSAIPAISSKVPSFPSQGSVSQPQQTPPNAAVDALTWEALGQLGGPLGQFRQQSFVAQQYQGVAASIASHVGGQSPQQNPDGTFQIDPETGGPVMGPNKVANFLQNSKPLNATIAGIQSVFNSGSNFADVGQSLGYGYRPGILGFLNRGAVSSYMNAAEQGASLRLERANLHMGGVLSSDQSQAVVDALAGAGFSNQNPYGLGTGDNNALATGVVAPAVQQGASAENATALTEALRNGSGSIQGLSTTISDLGTAARATKLTTDTLTASLNSFANSQVANGGTAGQADVTGMDFTAATGLAPNVLSTLQNNPMYQGIMMGQNGVLPSDIGNLTPGDQLQGASSMISMLGNAFQGLNQNKYETVGGVKMVSSYGGQAEAAQIAQMSGLPQAEVMRLMAEQQSGTLNASINALKVLGNSEAGVGGRGSGLFSILNQAKNWQGLSQSERNQATTVWNQGISPNLKGMGLTESQMRTINSAKNVDTRAQDLQKFMLNNQGNSNMNQINGSMNVKLELSGSGAKLFKVANPNSLAKLTMNAGGSAANTIMNSPLADVFSSSTPGRIGK